MMRTVWLILFMLCLVIFVPVSAQEEQPSVVVVVMQGEINETQVALLHRAYTEARDKNAAAVILELDTFGGLVDSAVKMRDMIDSMPVRTICFVKNRAWSAGALISLAHQHIVMAQGGSIGAAEPIPATEKNISALKAEFSATAGKHGRNPRIAEAMVDKTMGYPGYAGQGQILSLTDSQAVAVGYAELIAADRTAMLAHYGLQHSTLREYAANWQDYAAGWLSMAAVKFFLLTVMFLAILVEFKTAGTGVAGLLAVAAASLLFTGQWLLGYAGWLEALLLLMGLLLLGAEFFVAGTGIFAAAGTLSLFAGVYLLAGAGNTAVYSILVSMLLAIGLFLIIVRRLPSSRLWTKLVLREAETGQAGFISGNDHSAYQGKTGKTLTALRPAGRVEIDGTVLDVVSEGEFIQPGLEVTVIDTTGNRMVVRLTKH